MNANPEGGPLWEIVLVAQSAPVVAAVVGLMILSGIISIGVTAYTWRHRKKPGAVGLGTLAAASGLWSVGYLIELLISDLQLKLLVANVEWIGVLVAPVAWFAFAFSYTGRDRYTAPGPLMIVSFLPMVTLIAAWTNPAHHFMWATSEVVPTATRAITLMDHQWGPLYWVILAYSYLLWLAGALALFQTMLDLPTIYRLQAITLIVGTLMPILGSLSTVLLELYGVALDVTPATFTFAGLAYAIALSQYDLLGSRPVPRSIACERVVKSMADAVVVTDTKWRIIALNQTAADILERTTTDLKGRPISSVISGTAAKKLNGNVAVKLGESQRDFELRTSTFTDFHGRPIGNALVFRDVTDRRRNVQQLEVMNRVLRHNLRTEANMLFGYADLVVEALANDSLDRAQRYSETVRDRAFSLVTISEKARKIAALHGNTTDEDETATPVPVGVQLEQAASTVRDDHPECVVLVESDLDDHIVCSPTLEHVVQELIENGVVHNYSDTPTVQVEAVESDDTVEIHVTDDGPGINPNELVAIRAHGETPLQHGSGLGLWLVTWGVDQLRGEVSFKRNNGSGTTASLQIPVQRVADDSDPTGAQNGEAEHGHAEGD
nr:histidine kinase N-terminal 7TM domain-containing protein [Haloferax larsenii]